MRSSAWCDLTSLRGLVLLLQLREQIGGYGGCLGLWTWWLNGPPVLAGAPAILVVCASAFVAGKGWKRMRGKRLWCEQWALVPLGHGCVAAMGQESWQQGIGYVWDWWEQCSCSDGVKAKPLRSESVLVWAMLVLHPLLRETLLSPGYYGYILDIPPLWFFCLLLSLFQACLPLHRPTLN